MVQLPTFRPFFFWHWILQQCLNMSIFKKNLTFFSIKKNIRICNLGQIFLKMCTNGQIKMWKKKISQTVLSSPIFEHRLIANDDLYKDELHNTVKILFNMKFLVTKIKKMPFSFNFNTGMSKYYKLYQEKHILSTI